MTILNVILKRFEDSDEVRQFDKGKFEIVRLGSMTVGRASNEPVESGQSTYLPLAGTPLCEVGHVGMVVSGKWRSPMTPPHAVKLPVTAAIPFECEFWAEDDGWTETWPGKHRGRLSIGELNLHFRLP